MKRQVHIRHRGQLNRKGKKRARMYIRVLGRALGMWIEYAVFSPSVLTRIVRKTHAGAIP